MAGGFLTPSATWEAPKIQDNNNKKARKGKKSSKSLYISPDIVIFICLCFSYTLEKEMAPRSSTLAWKIPWMEEPCRLQSMGSQRVGHDWATSLDFTSAQLACCNPQKPLKVARGKMLNNTKNWLIQYTQKRRGKESTD